MIILSVTEKNERGKAFEEFVAILFSKLGYQIKNTRIRRAGRELDIQAISKVTNAPILMECKAFSKLIDGPAFSKFYGIYDHEYRRELENKSTLTGLFVSLSGFNSEVLDYYQEKDNEVKQRFKVLGPTEIIKLAVDADLILDDSTIKHLASRSWPFDLGETILIITKTRLYRVQLLRKDDKVSHFIAFRAKGEYPTEHEIFFLHENITFLKKLESFNLSARKEILLALTESESPVSIDILIETTKQSMATIDTEINYLKDQNLVEKTEKDKLILVQDLRSFCEVSKEFLDFPLKYKYLLSFYFKKLNNVKLAEYCLSRRCLEISQDQEKALLISIFTYSPSALKKALFGDIKKYQTTYDHVKRIGTAPERISHISKSSFYTEIILSLLNDLHDEKNIILQQIQPIVGFKEEYKVVLANSYNRILEITAGGVMCIQKAGQALKAGEIVTSDPITSFNSIMTVFNLTGDEKCFNEMEQIYKELKSKKHDEETLAGLANNIGICYMVIKRLDDAKKWLIEGLSQSNTIPQLQQNLAKVQKNLKGPK